jgi:DNA-binding response OmpR family regulator
VKVFLVENDRDFNKELVSILEKESEVSTFIDGKFAQDNLDRQFNLYIINTDLPNVDGFTLLTHIKENHPDAYTIMISEHTNLETIEKAYKLGCNDFLKKPFYPKELLLKINLIADKLPQSCYIAEDLFFNKDSSVLVYKEQQIPLTGNEIKFINILLASRGKLVSADQLLDQMWNNKATNDALRKLVSRLRQKVPTDFIITRSRQGYLIP